MTSNSPGIRVRIDFAQASDPGRDPNKQVNEDSCGYAETKLGHLLVLCDGMGGHYGGKEASRTAITTIFEMMDRAPPGTLPGSALKAAIDRLDAELSQPMDYQLDDAWQPLRTQLLELAAGRGVDQPAPAYAVHTQAVEAIRQLGLLNGHRSGLVLDPVAHSYYLGDLLIGDMPLAMEAVAVARHVGTQLLLQAQRQENAPTDLAADAKTPSAAERRVLLMGQAAQMRRSLADLDTRVAFYERSGGVALRAWPAARDSLSAMARQVDALFATDTPGGRGADFFDKATTTIDQLQGLANEAAMDLQAQLAARQADNARQVVLQACSA